MRVQPIGIIEPFVCNGIGLGSGIRRTAGQAGRQRGGGIGGLDEQAVVTGKGHDLAIDVDAVLTEHLLVRDALAQSGLLDHVVNERDVRRHGSSRVLLAVLVGRVITRHC